MSPVNVIVSIWINIELANLSFLIYTADGKCIDAYPGKCQMFHNIYCQQILNFNVYSMYV